MNYRLDSFKNRELFSTNFKKWLLIAVQKRDIVAISLNYIQQHLTCEFLDKYPEFREVVSIREVDIFTNECGRLTCSFSQYRELGKKDTRDSELRKEKRYSKLGRTVHTIIKDYGHLLGITITDRQIEKFVLLLDYMITGKNLRFEEVKGEDIRYYYSKDNYADEKAGTLGNSCMRHDDTQRYMDIYVECKYCSMLVLFDETIDKVNIVGRALLWHIDDQVYMDRRYYHSESHDIAMLDYAKKQGWNYRAGNGPQSDIDCWYVKTGEIYKLHNLQLDVPAKLPDYFPYLDTFKYYDIDRELLCNYEPEGCGSFYFLESTDGDANFNNMSCYDCGRSLSMLEGHYEVDGNYYCPDCVVTDLEGETIPSCKACSVETIKGIRYMLKDDPRCVFIEGRYYLKDYDKEHDTAYEIESRYLSMKDIERMLSQGWEISGDYIFFR
jgi:hypothetical protein